MTKSLPDTIRAAVLVETGAALQIRELPFPEPDHGALVVKVRASTVCGSDVHLWRGGGHPPLDLPVVLGHEIVGEIVAFGPDSEFDSLGQRLQLGDRIIWTHESCGHCHGCTVLRIPTMCANLRLGLKQDLGSYPYQAAGFADYAYVWPKAGKVRISDDVKDGWASSASCALRTVINGFERLGRIEPHEHIVIQGSGPLGLYATAVAAVAGPASVVVIGSPDDRLALATKWGATAVVSIDEHRSEEARLERIQELTGGRGADILIEVSGAPGAVAEGLEMAARGGRYVVIGPTGGAPQPVRAPAIVQKQLSILGVLGAATRHYAAAIDFVSTHQGRFSWDDMLGNEYSLDDASAAMARAADQSEMKPVIVPGLGR